MRIGAYTVPRLTEFRLRRSARKGAKLLDKIAPQWFTTKGVRLSKLRMSSGCKCVFGQVEAAVGAGEIDTCHVAQANDILSRLETDANYDLTGDFLDLYDDEGVGIISELSQDEFGYSYQLRDLHAIVDANYPKDVDAPELAYAVLQDEWGKLIRSRRAKQAARA